jgi:hypothetical protein
MFDSPYDNLFSEFKIGLLFLLRFGFVLGLVTKFNKIFLISFYYARIWFLPALRTKFISFIGLYYGKIVHKYWDRGWNELMGPRGVSAEINVLAVNTDKLNHLNVKIVLLISFVRVVVMCLAI